MRAARIALPLLALASYAAPGARELAAQRQDCTLRVEPQPGRTGYRNRGYRCEGMYVGLQSAPRNVQVVSLVKGGLRYALPGAPGAAPGDTLLYVHVPALPASFGRAAPVLLLGRGREANLNWALDAAVPPGRHLAWNLADVVAPERLPSRRIGIAGQAGGGASGSGGTVHIPLAVGRSPSAGTAPDSIEMVVKVPGAARVRWFFASNQAAAEAERLNVDGYFRIVLPPRRGPPGVELIGISWRPRGQPTWNEVPEHLRIYRW